AVCTAPAGSKRSGRTRRARSPTSTSPTGYSWSESSREGLTSDARGWRRGLWLFRLDAALVQRRPSSRGSGERGMRRAHSAGNIAGFAFGVGTLLGAAGLARRRITQAEIRIFREANELPGDVYRAIWIPMQYGTFGTVPAAAALALARRRPRLGLAIAAGGTAAWVLAKAVKPMVDRGRPASILGDVSLRGAEEGDEGIPSWHAAGSGAR